MTIKLKVGTAARAKCDEGDLAHGQVFRVEHYHPGALFIRTFDPNDDSYNGSVCLVSADSGFEVGEFTGSAGWDDCEPVTCELEVVG